jgi:hypothetical protein
MNSLSMLEKGGLSWFDKPSEQTSGPEIMMVGPTPTSAPEPENRGTLTKYGNTGTLTKYPAINVGEPVKKEPI